MTDFYSRLSDGELLYRIEIAHSNAHNAPKETSARSGCATYARTSNELFRLLNEKERRGL